MTILLTGAAGFIGAHTARALLVRSERVVGIDNFNAYYDPQLKRDRVAALCPQLELNVLDIVDKPSLDRLFADTKPRAVIHLAAQAGVRHSLKHPYDYLHSNLAGFLNVLEACRQNAVDHLVFASTSSIYGSQRNLPFSETMPIQTPLSLYSASKGANELMAHAYSHLFGFACTALRFFTVYGPWGRPDMAPVIFSRAILAGNPIEVYNHGAMRRDFTYISDIVAGIIGALGHPPEASPRFAVYNLGASAPIELEQFIKLVERAAGRPALREMKALQAGDMLETYADTRAAAAAFGYAPEVPIEAGVTELVQWCKNYFTNSPTLR